MLYVNDYFCVIDKYLKNDDKFNYFSLKYNMTSKSVKFFLFFEFVGQGLMFIEMYMNFLSVAAFFCFLALKKGNFLGKSDSGKQVPSSCCYGNQTMQYLKNILSKMYTSNFNLYNCTS